MSLHDREPTYLFDRLVPVQHEGRQTRATEAGLLTVPHTKTNYGRMGYSFRGPVQWNITNIELKAATNKLQLKSLLRSSWYKVGSK